MFLQEEKCPDGIHLNQFDLLNGLSSNRSDSGGPWLGGSATKRHKAELCPMFPALAEKQADDKTVLPYEHLLCFGYRCKVVNRRFHPDGPFDTKAADSYQKRQATEQALFHSNQFENRTAFGEPKVRYSFLFPRKRKRADERIHRVSCLLSTKSRSYGDREFENEKKNSLI